MIMSLTVPSAFRQKILPAFRTWLFPEKQEVYYIGGSDILPPPLRDGGKRQGNQNNT
ncbi:hypothetical protein [Sellimonas intestinalis]|uniref:hypothetical protein n=1 Tax=Sellimonas intestinalis TaxID=1653434 RepID=UPI00399BE3E9